MQETKSEEKAEAWAWRRPRQGRRRRRACPPPGAPLLLWVNALALQGAVPPAAVHVALSYLVEMDAMRGDLSVCKKYRNYSEQLLRGNVSRAKAHSFLHMVLEDMDGRAEPGGSVRSGADQASAD